MAIVMATLEEQLISGIAAMSPQDRAIVDRWIDSDPQAVRILGTAVPALQPMLLPFINGNGEMPNPASAQTAMQGAKSLVNLTRGGMQ